MLALWASFLHGRAHALSLPPAATLLSRIALDLMLGAH
jgi:hypothetical protein